MVHFLMHSWSLIFNNTTTMCYLFLYTITSVCVCMYKANYCTCVHQIFPDMRRHTACSGAYIKCTIVIIMYMYLHEFCFDVHTSLHACKCAISACTVEQS